jgi:hypothetical protein
MKNKRKRFTATEFVLRPNKAISHNVLRLGGRFNAAKPLLWAVAVY